MIDISPLGSHPDGPQSLIERSSFIVPRRDDPLSTSTYVSPFSISFDGSHSILKVDCIVKLRFNDHFSVAINETDLALRVNGIPCVIRPKCGCYQSTKDDRQ